jgi:hypothetical protein
MAEEIANQEENRPDESLKAFNQKKKNDGRTIYDFFKDRLREEFSEIGDVEKKVSVRGERVIEEMSIDFLDRNQVISKRDTEKVGAILGRTVLDWSICKVKGAMRLTVSTELQ